MILECISLLMLLRKNARASSCTPKDSRETRGIYLHLRDGDDEREIDCGVRFEEEVKLLLG